MSPKLMLIPLLWSLLISKCFTLEYLVEAYSVPINSAIYVWLLSISMAMVATILYLCRNRDKVRAHIQGKAIRSAIIALSFLLASVLTTQSVISKEWGHNLSILSALLALNYGLIASDRHFAWSWFSSMAWVLSALALFWIPLPLGIAVFASGIILFSTLPMLVQQIKTQRAIKRAIRALNENQTHE